MFKLTQPNNPPVDPNNPPVDPNNPPVDPNNPPVDPTVDPNVDVQPEQLSEEFQLTRDLLKWVDATPMEQTSDVFSYEAILGNKCKYRLTYNPHTTEDKFNMYKYFYNTKSKSYNIINFPNDLHFSNVEEAIAWLELDIIQVSAEVQKQHDTVEKIYGLLKIPKG